MDSETRYTREMLMLGFTALASAGLLFGIQQWTPLHDYMTKSDYDNMLLGTILVFLFGVSTSVYGISRVQDSVLRFWFAIVITCVPLISAAVFQTSGWILFPPSIIAVIGIIVLARYLLRNSNST